jgi:hypothetical protein
VHRRLLGIGLAPGDQRPPSERLTALLPRCTTARRPCCAWTSLRACRPTPGNMPPACAHAWRCARRRAPHPEPADTQARSVHRCRARCRRYRLVGRPGRPLPQRGCQRLAGRPARCRSASARQPQGQLWRCGRDRWRRP